MRHPKFFLEKGLDLLLPLGEEKGLCQSALGHFHADGRDGLCDVQHRVHAQPYLVVLQHPVQLPIDLQGNEADADVGLDPVLVEVEYRTYLKLGL